MKYGCIAERLKHSFSKEIHNALADYEYELKEIPRGELDAFMRAREFRAINVTIPYKEAVIPYLDTVDEQAKKIDAVNTIVNREGKLHGYNTDFYGMVTLIERMGLSIAGKKVLVLGTGGTSKTAVAVAEHLNAATVRKVSRTAKDGAITYEEAYAEYSDTEILLNTTPAGMYPDIEGCPIDIDRFPALCGVVDAIYNPLRSTLVRRALERGIPAEGGLFMLVAQAALACEKFIDTEISLSKTDAVYRKLLSEKENVVLTGMPGCGKSTLGRLLADALGRSFLDTDDEIVKRIGMSIPEYFAAYGEKDFRRVESEVIAEIAAPVTSAIIATGGGAILNSRNVDMLKRNGRLFFLDRPLDQLRATADRPLSSSREMLEERYRERYPIYLSICDEHIKTSQDKAQNVNMILEKIKA